MPKAVALGLGERDPDGESLALAGGLWELSPEGVSEGEALGLGVAHSEEGALAEQEGDPLWEGVVEALVDGVGKNEVEGHWVAQDALAPFDGLVAALRVCAPQWVGVWVRVAHVVSVLDREEVRQVEGVTEWVVEWEGEAERERVLLPVPVIEGDRETMAVAVAAWAVAVG